MFESIGVKIDYERIELSTMFESIDSNLLFILLILFECICT
jgi:hypothetical protein